METFLFPEYYGLAMYLMGIGSAIIGIVLFNVLRAIVQARRIKIALSNRRKVE